MAKNKNEWMEILIEKEEKKGKWDGVGKKKSIRKHKGGGKSSSSKSSSSKSSSSKSKKIIKSTQFKNFKSSRGREKIGVLNPEKIIKSKSKTKSSRKRVSDDRLSKSLRKWNC